MGFLGNILGGNNKKELLKYLRNHRSYSKLTPAAVKQTEYEIETGKITTPEQIDEVINFLRAMSKN